VHGYELDQKALAEYKALPEGRSVPTSLIEKSIVCHNEDDVMNLAKSFYGARDGYANTHDLPTLDRFMEQAAAGPLPTGETHMCCIAYCIVGVNHATAQATMVTTRTCSLAGTMAWSSCTPPAVLWTIPCRPSLLGQMKLVASAT